MTIDQEIDLVLSPAGDVMTLAGDQLPTVPCQVMEQDIPRNVDQPSPGVLINMKSVLVRASAFPDLKDQDLVNLKRREETIFTEFRVLGPPQRIQDGKIFELLLGVVDE